MADRPIQPAAPADEEQQEGNPLFSSLKRMAIIWIGMNLVMRFIGGNQESSKDKAGPVVTTDSKGQMTLTPNLKSSFFTYISKPETAFTIDTVTKEDGTVETHEIKTMEQVIFENSQKPAVYYYPIWDQEGYTVDLKFFVNDKESVDVNDEPLWTVKDVELNSKNDHTEHFTLTVPDSVKYHNGSLYLHAFIANPNNASEAGYKRLELSTYMPKRKEVKLHKLIGGDDTDETEEPETQSTKEMPIVAYWHPNVTVSIAKPPGIIDTRSLPPPLINVFPLDPLDRRDNSTGLVTQYFPLIYQNKFWQLKDHMNEINGTTETLDFNLHLDFAAFWKIQTLVIFSDGLQQQQNNPMAMTDGSEIDGIKKILLDTNPYLLGITMIVTLLHTLLEFLAFKSDISHWKNKKNNVGVSVRSIVANVVQQVITLLYLIDNSDGTSYMILFSQGMGILVEAWKITTVVNIEVVWNGIIPSLNITDKYELSETEEKTKEYDSIAFKYLYMVAAPLLIAYAAYSVMYKEHKSWYSFVVSTLVGFVYTYGFLTLVPSVYINYRLKSVAHVPKKAMAYKVVNTFIDDLFAFVVKMPWLHRLATLRDDVIFFIYLYQTWIYRVDYSRINEFGQGGDEDEEEEETSEEKTAAVTSTKKLNGKKESKKQK